MHNLRLAIGRWTLVASVAAAFLALGRPAIFGAPAPAVQPSTKNTLSQTSCLAIQAQTGVTLLSGSSAKWDAGDVGAVRNVVLSHSFQVKNCSKRKVTITGLYGACGCTTGMLTDSRALPVALAPGDTVSIQADVDLSDVIPGPMDEMLWVIVSSQAWPAATFEIVGKVDRAALGGVPSTNTTK